MFLHFSKLELTSTLSMEDFRRKWNITSWAKYGVLETPSMKEPASNEISKTQDGKWKPIIYAVLGFAGLIVLFGIIGIVYLIRSRRR